VRVSVDQSRNGRVTRFLERIEVQFRVVDVAGRSDWDELFANGIVQGVLPVDKAQNVWRKPACEERKKS
jgi:hypothetical protein